MWDLILAILSSSLYLISAIWGSTLGFWMCLEFANLLLLSSFFSCRNNSNRYLALLLYLLMNGVSGGLIFASFLSENLSNLFVLGLYVKAGGIPFIGWINNVFSGLSWLALFVLSVVSKAPILWIVNLHYVCDSGYIYPVSNITWIALASIFWFGNVGIKHFLGLASIASSVFLIVFSFQEDNCLEAYILYASYVICFAFLFSFLCYLEGGINTASQFTALLYLLVGVPFSLFFIYKFVSILCALTLPPQLIICWVVCSVSEQLFLSILILEKMVFNFRW